VGQRRKAPSPRQAQGLYRVTQCSGVSQGLGYGSSQCDLLTYVVRCDSNSFTVDCESDCVL
jgi:hypothetical protein